MRLKKTVGALLCAAALPILAPPAIAAPPPGACHDPEPARPRVREQPWAQALLDPARVWSRTRGAGVLVAVVDSGVDIDHPQLSRPGKVLPGKDFVEPSGWPGAFDCVSHGTAVAGVIAADPTPGTGFHGIAPDATLLPVRISERDIGDRGESVRVDPAAVAAGVRYAADQGAKVLNLSLAGYEDFPTIRDAIAYAVAKDVLVVAAVGNGQRDDLPGLPSFPAGYDGVLGVGAVDIAGERGSGSQVGPYVDLVAPGVKVLSTTRVDGHSYVDGTSFAAPFVAGTAALVRSAWPTLTAPEVARRLLATAAPGRGGPGFGAGLVDPYRAVFDGVDTAKPAKLPVYVPSEPDHGAIAAAANREATARTAKWLTAVTVGIVTLAGIIAAVLPRGRRQRWQPTLAREPVSHR